MWWVVHWSQGWILILDLLEGEINLGLVQLIPQGLQSFLLLLEVTVFFFQLQLCGWCLFLILSWRVYKVAKASVVSICWPFVAWNSRFGFNLWILFSWSLELLWALWDVAFVLAFIQLPVECVAFRFGLPYWTNMFVNSISIGLTHFAF